MQSHIPLLYEPSIDIVGEYLKYLQGKGYSKFYQAVGYIGLFDKYDANNCCSVCTICKQGLLFSCGKKGEDLPLIRTYVDGTVGIKTSPVVVYVVCYGCYKKYYQTRDTVPRDVIRKEIDFMLHSRDSRWIRNQQLVQSPFVSGKI
jgi:hypothetical protein